MYGTGVEDITVVYNAELSTPVKDVPLLQHPEWSKYGQNPDIALMDDDRRAKWKNTLRQRWFRFRNKQLATE